MLYFHGFVLKLSVLDISQSLFKEHEAGKYICGDFGTDQGIRIELRRSQLSVSTLAFTPELLNCTRNKILKSQQGSAARPVEEL